MRHVRWDEYDVACSEVVRFRSVFADREAKESLENVADLLVRVGVLVIVATQKQTDSTRLTIEDMAKLAEGLNSSVAQFKLA